ncbi:MAG TPA: fused MFS/spermidine synthase [Bryobacteraceae bacterium]|nr:fused MFS/spermidine synthase [Bryobacteraceae bacterium]
MILYALTIVVSAFLLFQVQPVIAKIILPWFGGSAAVWTTCLLFFQVVLLLGYLYAHAVIRYLKPRMQMLVHAGLLLVSAAALPIYPNASWKPYGNEDPSLRILGLLAATVGLPYFLLSTTGPLLQAWYARRYKGAIPYRLYALSNAGSMFALLSYPVLFEPIYTTHQQALMWSVAYVLFAALCAVTAFRSGTAVAAAETTESEAAHKPGATQYWAWMGLAACASVMLLAVTNHMSQNIAAIPFLWILPLSIYLLSFILCFEGSGWYRRTPYLQLFAVALGSMAYAMSSEQESNLPIKVMLPLFAMGLFTCCMVCHGELARLKPHPKYLTHFYLMISAGGALGGIFVGLVAPHWFNAFYEMPVGMAGCALLVVMVLKQDPELEWFQNFRQPAPLVAAGLTVALITYLGMQIRDGNHGALVLARNFYGGLKVRDSGPATRLDAVRSLTHGTINHGEEFLNPARRDWPTTYYGPNTGIGVAIREKQKQGPIRVGVIGLGTGTISAYGRPGDYYRFYEINPLVPRIARGEFHFVPDSKAHVDIAMGDARLSLEREQPENFDVLAVDAFSSDSIPVHLLTRQAMDLFFHHLKPDGILAVHISNRYLDLQPVVRGEAQATGKITRLVDTDDDDSQDVFGATWVLVTSPAAGFSKEIVNASHEVEKNRTVRLWTDDFSNLYQILK